MASSFGRDISCTTGLRTGRFASGPRLVAEAAYRRLTTPRGSLIGADAEADYGIDLLDLLGSATTAAAAASLEGRVAAELSKDERIEHVSVSVVVETNGPSTSFDVAIEGETAEGPFSLAVGVEDVTIDLLGMSPEV